MSLVPLGRFCFPCPSRREGASDAMGSYACACSRPAPASIDAEPSLDDALGHSFCYASSAAAHSSSFRHAISGDALSANYSVPVPLYQSSATGAMPPNYSSAFQTSSSFSSALLQLSNLSSGPSSSLGPSAAAPSSPAQSTPLCPSPVRSHRSPPSLLPPHRPTRPSGSAVAATEAAYLDMTDQSMGSHEELAVTGACLLVALVRDDNVYVMNLGDSAWNHADGGHWGGLQMFS